MASKWDRNDGTFHLGINMAGAVSAGAYTAGVLDFLMEALEQWYAEKGAPNAQVPMHDISLDVFSGASAGGMCAAIAAVMVQGSFQHIHDSTLTGTNNRFYESWVNRIDIEYLLEQRDLGDGKPVISLLDSTIIDDIAKDALTPIAAFARPYISKSLTLFLALTNVRGVPFSLNGTAAGSAEEDIAYYADRLEFETVSGTSAPLSSAAKPLPVGTNAGAWPLLQEAAKATGAFPIFLAPRKLDRAVADYLNSPWEPLSVVDPPPVLPHWPLHADDPFATLNVDGGLTDNDPFELAHDFLAARNPLAERDPNTGELKNPQASNLANCAVLTVAPFPADDLFQKDYNFDQNGSILGMLPNLLTVLISQSRFFGESLTAVMSGQSSSRFVLAPSDADHPNTNALQCAVLGAFGGFLERGFRAHDYQLGRRNCQKFLKDHFRLSTQNPIIAKALSRYAEKELKDIQTRFDNPLLPNTIPIIPLCGTAGPEVKAPEPAKITMVRVNLVLNWIVDRLHAVAKPLIESQLGTGFEGFTLRAAVDGLISTWGKAKLKELLLRELKDVIQG